MSDEPAASPFKLQAFYFVAYTAVGVTLPFLPVYYRHIGIDEAHIGLLLSVGPVLLLFGPPIWGQLADRTGRPGTVLAIVCLGGTAGFALLLFADRFDTVFLSVLLFASFNCALTTLIDSLTLAHVGRHGGTYARIRSFGSLGFIVASLAFGTLMTVVDGRLVVVALTLHGLTAVWAMLTLTGAPAATSSGPRVTILSAVQLLRAPQMPTLLLASGLHWIANTPYHGSLGLHFTALNFRPITVSLCSAVGVISELIIFALWPRWFAHRHPRTLLLIAYATGALRWAGMGLTSSPVLLVALAGLHGLSFAAFYVASVTWASTMTPPHLRSTGQALLVASVYGVGGLIGYSASGRIYADHGGHTLFLLAAAFELLPLALSWWGLKPIAKARIA